MHVHLISKILYFVVHVFITEDNWLKSARFFKRFRFFRTKSELRVIPGRGIFGFHVNLQRDDLS